LKEPNLANLKWYGITLPAHFTSEIRFYVKNMVLIAQRGFDLCVFLNSVVHLCCWTTGMWFCNSVIPTDTLQLLMLLN